MASYFCLSDGTVVHAVAGPLNAAQFLREARWAVDVRRLAVVESRGDIVKYRAAVRKGHVERLQAEQGVTLPRAALPHPSVAPAPVPAVLRLNGVADRGTQAQVHALLAVSPLARLEQLYPVVFEQVLKEKVSTLPVKVSGGPRGGTKVAGSGR